MESKTTKPITWDDITNLFLKSLLERDNTYFTINQSKGSLEKVALNPNIANMIRKLNIVRWLT
jgi:hypothetical protein